MSEHRDSTGVNITEYDLNGQCEQSTRIVMNKMLYKITGARVGSYHSGISLVTDVGDTGLRPVCRIATYVRLKQLCCTAKCIATTPPQMH